MRFLIVLVLLLIANTVAGQNPNTTLPPEFFAQSELQAELQVKNQLIEDLRAIIRELEACPCCKCEHCQCAQMKAVPAKLVMVSMPGCPACDEWWANESPRYRSSGWAVEHASESPKRGRLYPYWRVCIGDSCEEIPWVPFNQLDGKVQAILDRRAK